MQYCRVVEGTAWRDRLRGALLVFVVMIFCFIAGGIYAYTCTEPTIHPMEVSRIEIVCPACGNIETYNLGGE